MEDEQRRFGNASHNTNLKRAHKRSRISDPKELIDVAVEYFGGRCALSGEAFTQDGNKDTMSMEHVVALDVGGHHIAPNIIPDVLRYNSRKKNSNVLDYWRNERNVDGDSIYSPYRLLKLVHYMLKSIQARQEYENSDDFYEQYRQTVLDEKDPIFQQIKRLEQEKTGAFFSDVVTTNDTELAEKIKITKVILNPSKRYTLKDDGLSRMNIFLHDALQNRLPQDIPQDDKEALAILAQLSELYKEIQEKYFPQMDHDIKLECMARDTIFRTFKDVSLPLDDKQYSIADEVVPVLIGKLQNRTNLSEEEIKEHIEQTIMNHIQKWLSLFSDKASDDIKTYPAILYDEEVFTRLQKYPFIRKELETQGFTIDIRNIAFAIKMVEEVTLSDGTKLNKEEQKKLLQKILSNAKLSEDERCYLSTLDDNLQKKGMKEQQERYRAILQFALGNQDVYYSYAIANLQVFRNMKKVNVNTELTREEIERAIRRKPEEDKTKEEWKKEYANRVGVEEKTVKVDYRNIAYAIKMIEEVTLSDGTKLSEEEQNKLLQKILSNAKLSGGKSNYLSILDDNLQKKGMKEQQERYRAIIQFALGNQDVDYSKAIANMQVFQNMTKVNVNTELTREEIERTIRIKPEEDKTKEEWKKEYANRVGVEEKTVKVDYRNIAYAIKMVEEVTLSDEAKLNREEQNKLLQKILSNALLSSDGNTCYLSTLDDNLQKKGIQEQQERYRAILQFALGNQDVDYTRVIQNSQVFQNMTKVNVNTDLTREEIERAVRRKPEEDKTKEEWKKEYVNRVGVEVEEKTVKVDYRNIAYAIKMIEEVTLSDGTKLSEEGQKKLLQKILSNTLLLEGRSGYLSTLDDNLQKKGMKEQQERYRAIIQFALGNQDVDYSNAIKNLQVFQNMTKVNVNTELTKEEIEIDVFGKIEGKTEEEWKKEYADRVGVEEKTVKVDYRNITYAIKMIEGVMLSDEAKLNREEQNKLLQKVLSNVLLSDDRTCYLSTLDDNLQKKGMKEQQERYRAIIQFALGNQDVNYTKAIKNLQVFQNMTKVNVNTELTREEISKAFSKGKKAKEAMRECVTREAVGEMGKIEHALGEMLVQEESHSLGE